MAPSGLHAYNHKHSPKIPNVYAASERRLSPTGGGQGSFFGYSGSHFSQEILGGLVAVVMWMLFLVPIVAVLRHVYISARRV
jgi:hypothetical protein